MAIGPLASFAPKMRARNWVLLLLMVIGPVYSVELVSGADSSVV